jgi:hypothetical protein
MHVRQFVGVAFSNNFLFPVVGRRGPDTPPYQVPWITRVHAPWFVTQQLAQRSISLEACWRPLRFSSMAQKIVGILPNHYIHVLDLVSSYKKLYFQNILDLLDHQGFNATCTCRYAPLHIDSHGCQLFQN